MAAKRGYVLQRKRGRPSLLVPTVSYQYGNINGNSLGAESTAKPKGLCTFYLNNAAWRQYVAGLPICLYFDLQEFFGKKQFISRIMILLLRQHGRLFPSNKLQVAAFGSTWTVFPGESVAKLSWLRPSEYVVKVAKEWHAKFVTGNGRGEQNVIRSRLLLTLRQIADVLIDFRSHKPSISHHEFLYIGGPISNLSTSQCDCRLAGSIFQTAETSFGNEIAATSLQFTGCLNRRGNGTATLDFAQRDGANCAVGTQDNAVRSIVKTITVLA